ncbi:MAG: alkaline phosphatase family protein [Pirellulales bacterium]|nr:alkaline phosphatase family protein [Pirellulales bacterium]
MDSDNKKVVCILADAMRADYIDRYELPFLTELRAGRRVYSDRVTPSTGFCEIVEYVTGQGALDHGMFAQITAVDDWQAVTIPPALRSLSRVKSAVESVTRFSKKVHRHTSPYFERAVALHLPEHVGDIRYLVPYTLLPYFQATEGKVEYDSFEFGQDKNLFLWMQSQGITYDIDDFVKFNKIQGTDHERFRRLKYKITSGSLKDFTMIYMSAAECAHYYSTDSGKTCKVLMQFDRELAAVFHELQREYDNCELIVLGDHGMVDVEEYIDVISEIEALADRHGMTVGEDFIYFVDSTVCRIWLDDRDRHTGFVEALSEALADATEADEATADYLGNFMPRFGDAIFLLKPGKTYFPDFFNVQKNLGMHGYLASAPGQQGLLLATGSDSTRQDIAEIKLYQMYDFFKQYWQHAA